MKDQIKTTNGTQGLAWFLLIIFCNGLFRPSLALAETEPFQPTVPNYIPISIPETEIADRVNGYTAVQVTTKVTGGPTQPEVQSFTPIGASDMVDPFTGDFSYNIPLMDVEGYPINIAYSSGVGMDQEASWVGLGWNLNVGAINRTMRGLPDEFNGDLVTKTESQKPQTEIGINGALNWELAGDTNKFNGSITPPSIAASVNFTYNNYRGFGTSIGFSPSFSLKNNNTVGFTVSGSDEDGAGFTGSYTLSRSVTKGSVEDAVLSNTFSGGYNSRAGLTYLSYQRAVNESANRGHHYDIMGASYSPGLNYYSPSSSPSYLSNSISGKCTGSLTFTALDAQWSAAITYNRQRIDPDNIVRTNKAYGYFNLEDGQRNPEALLDFNRDDDRAFTKFSPALPSAFLTNDIFTVQAQGVSGSYRAFRSEVGYVFDPVSESHSTSNNLGLETGFGNFSDFSLDYMNYQVDSYSGKWRNSNLAAKDIEFENAEGLNENSAFQEGGERAVDTDPLFTGVLSGASPQYLYLSGTKRYPILTNNTDFGSIDENNRTERLKRNQLLSFLTIQDVRNGLGLNDENSQVYGLAPLHHIGEITQLGTDGRRYVFGIPAYNHFQEDVSFAIGNDLYGEGLIEPIDNDDYAGLVYVEDFDDAASTDNNYGIDHSYSSQKMPAYAHSFMLTAVLSDDYIDSDNEKGPSVNDFGSYVAFDYQKIDNVLWKSPPGDNEAFQNVGLKTDLTDDRASFIYGEKEVWYAKTIKTKNYVAVFEIDDREDAAVAIDRSGGLVNTESSVKQLKKISLYTIKEYNAHMGDLENANALQEVHFVYDYSLCEGYPGNLSGGGKLTLKEIYFTYQGSYKLKRSSYRFDYGADDPLKNQDYNMKAVDRWGNFQATGSGEINYIADDTPLNSSDFPYTIQDPELAAENVSQWTLRDIYLPSGGKIHVDYESDDYAYVQHKEASQMYAIVKTGDVNDNINSGSTTVTEPQKISPRPTLGEVNPNQNRALFFKLKPGFTEESDYFIPGERVYFKCLLNMGTESVPRYEFVTGYANLKEFKEMEDGIGRVILEPEWLTDNHLIEAKYSPITKAGILFGRANMPRYIYDVTSGISTPGDSPDENAIVDFVNSVVNSVASLTDLLESPNQNIYDYDHCQELITQHSFLRLLEPKGHKYGGGLRVKEIKIYDNWGTMTQNSDENSNYYYGQTYQYVLEDGRSSGVASYEPVVGGDENSWKTGRPYQEKIALSPDKEIFLSNPIMESQFPSPSVGYSRIVIADLSRTGVERTATGKVVKEFYTAKDFPTIVKRTNLNKDESLKVATSFLPFVPKYDYLTASQGYVIENNDMHGKPKSEAVYGQGQSKPLSTVHYDYKKSQAEAFGIQQNYFVLDNNVTVIAVDGTSETAEIGVKYDAVADFRESSTSSLGIGPIEFNVNTFLTGPGYMVLPAIYSKIDKSISQFRSSTLNKTITRFGILEKITANQDGSIVETNNLAYDKETGEVLVTQTTTNFNDKVYSLSFPAHWRYDAMGPAYRNIGYQLIGYVVDDGQVMIAPSLNNFTPGDEVKLAYGSTIEKAWVTSVDENGFVLKDKSGALISSGSNYATITIIRSGRRNKQSTGMASITMLDNPLTGLTSDDYSNVLNSSAVEFTDVWKTYCDCASTEVVEGEGGGPPPAPLLEEGTVGFSNPYTNGTRGTWRPIRSYTYLTNRTQSHGYNNTNIRKDGVYTSFSPYYAYNNGAWQINPYNWTFVSEVTNFSPNGMTLETRDALGRYSSSLFSFNNTLTTAVAVNAQQRQIAAGSFEDVGFTNCMDLGLFSKQNAGNISDRESHTGRMSIEVPSQGTVTYASSSNGCDDDADCRISVIPIGPNTYQVNGSVTATTVIISDNEESTDITFSGGILTIDFDSGEYLEAEITLTDQVGGCKVVVGIKSVLPDNEQLGMTIISSGPL